MDLSAFILHEERRSCGCHARLVFTVTATGRRVEGPWCDEREAPSIDASAVVPGTPGYLELTAGTLVHCTRTTLAVTVGERVRDIVDESSYE